MNPDDPYRFLKVTEDVTIAGLKKRYRGLAFALHPDRNPASDAAEQFARVSVAYEYILKKLERGPAKKPRQSATPCRGCKGRKKIRTTKGFYVGPWQRCPDCK